MISGDSLSNVNSSGTNLNSPKGEVQTEEDVIALFAGIEWSRVNVEELRREWSNELGQIERENVKALTEVAEKSQTLLPSLQKAIKELGQVEGVLSEYAGRLKQMGSEIQQIETINKGLGQQTKNQQILLEELDNLIEEIDLDDQMMADLQLSLDSPGHVGRIETAALHLHQAANHRFEHGMGRMRAVEERQSQLKELEHQLMSKVRGYLEQRLAEAAQSKASRGKPEVSQTSLTELLTAYGGLVRVLTPSPQLSLLKDAYLKALAEGPVEDYREWLDTVRSRKRSSAEPYLFRSSLSAPSNLVTSQRAFSLVKLGDPVPDDLRPNEGLSGGQLLQMALLMLARLMTVQQECLEELFERDSLLLKTVTERYTAPLSKFIDALVQADLSLSVEMLAILDEREAAMPPTLLEYAQGLRKRLMEFSRAFLQEQVLAINEFKLSTKKRTGVLPFIPLVPAFIRHHETLVEGLPSSATSRQVSYFALNLDPDGCL